MFMSLIDCSDFPAVYSTTSRVTVINRLLWKLTDDKFVVARNNKPLMVNHSAELIDKQTVQP